LQTQTVERLSTRHQTILATFPGFRKPLYSCTEGMYHSSIRTGTSYHLTQFYQAFPRISTASDKCWGKKAWVRDYTLRAMLISKLHISCYLIVFSLAALRWCQYGCTKVPLGSNFLARILLNTHVFSTLTETSDGHIELASRDSLAVYSHYISICNHGHYDLVCSKQAVCDCWGLPRNNETCWVVCYLHCNYACHTARGVWREKEKTDMVSLE